MIDFHTHILPNIDDGSTSMDETINLILEAKQVGFTGVISTSHYIQGYYETNEAERKKILCDVEKNVNELNLYLASEIYITTEIAKLINDGSASTINNTKYVLFELPMNSKPLFVKDVIYGLIGYGYKPIIAHPERYNYVQENIGYVEELASMGTLFQANYGSILGQYGKNAQFIVTKFLENNMIHFLGSDVHRQNTVYKVIPQALKEIEEIVGASKLEELTTKNPKLALQNKRIDIAEPEEFKLTLKERIKLLISEYFKK